MPLISEETRQAFRDFIPGSCVSYIFATKLDGKEVLHPRAVQPCYGELRKYKRTHGDQATKPENRPGDLHWPFPEGTPIGACFPFENGGTEEFDTYVRFLFSDKSPWVRGFGSEKNVEFVLDEKGHVKSVIIDDSHFDPTVLVNLLKVIQSNLVSGFTRWLKAGASELEAILMSNFGVLNRFCPNTYIWPLSLDVPAFFSQNSRDLTGGTWHDRMDYDRKNMHCIFERKGQREGGEKLGERLEQACFPLLIKKKDNWGCMTTTIKDGLTDEDVVKACRTVFEEEMKRAA